ncbi:NYN domain-containing protein [candidate division WOR-3 bacterium]|nr:NYN domain-containing protein [candidate division WOR-3 bacterium]
MKKILIVDGYNMLGRSFKKSFDEQSREKLLSKVKAVTASGKYYPVLVFDGKGKSSSREKRPGAEIIFSGEKDEADDLIVKLIENGCKKNIYTVVTADRLLSKRCKYLGASVVSKLENVLKKKKKAEINDDKINPNVNLDYWLKVFKKGGIDEV